MHLHADGASARADVLAILAGAEHEILVESYSWSEDDFTDAVADVLARKVGEGVTVNGLVDAIGSRTTAGNGLERLARQGVPTATFLAPNPLKGRFQINFRNHRKLLVVDGTRAVTGGRNMGGEYFESGDALDPCQPCVLLAASLGLADQVFQAGVAPTPAVGGTA